MLSTFESVKIKFEVRLSNEFDKTERDGPNGIRDQTLNSTKLTLNASLG